MPKRIPRRVNFTKAAIQRLSPPAEGRLTVHDTKTPGLSLRITNKGNRSFYVFRRVKGRPQRVRLGSWPVMTIEQARRETVKVNAEIAVGKDPADERQRMRRELKSVRTFQQVFEHYQENGSLSDKTLQGDTYLFGCISLWKSRRIDALSVADVRTLHRKVSTDRGPIMANRTVQLLRRLFNYAADELLYTPPNPVRISRSRRRSHDRRTGGVQLNREKTRDRFLHPDEAPKFFEALAHEATHPTVRDLLWLLLLTGARRSNVQTMRWSDLNLDRALWKFAQAKTGELVTLPLSRWAVAVLERRRDLCNGSPFVFPAKSASGHIVEPKKHWWQIRKRAGVPDLTMHDLRRTLATWQRLAGSSIDTIASTLGHRIGGVTGVYARIDADTMRQSMEAGTVKLLEAGGVELW